MEPISEEAVEKTEIDLIHVPGVVFNSQGFRIGYGGGYYDRYLADFCRRHPSAGIYSFQNSDFEPNYHDIAVRKY